MLQQGFRLPDKALGVGAEQNGPHGQFSVTRPLYVGVRLLDVRISPGL